MPDRRLRILRRAGARRNWRVRCALCACWLCALASASARAQELEPKAYANAPVGLNFFIAGYAGSEGGVVVDPALPLENANLTVHSGLLAYARSFEAWGRSAKFDLIAPYAWLSGTAEIDGETAERDVSGWADPRLRVSVNVFGAPAMSLREIADYRQDLIVGASLEVRAPVGQYDEARVVNLGANRWAVKPEIGLSKAAGRWTFELAAAASFYEDNDDYLTNHTREQAPIYSAQFAVIHSFPGGIWVAAAGTFYTGGRTSIDGVEGGDLQENSRVGVIVTFPVSRRYSLKVFANTGVSTRTGNDFDGAGVVCQYRWGGGL
jgi:Putative MetA-pathway of phenol degradation